MTEMTKQTLLIVHNLISAIAINCLSIRTERKNEGYDAIRDKGRNKVDNALMLIH